MRIFRGLGLFIAVTSLVWVGVLWHWQSTRRDMSVEDILVYLGALPVTLFVLLLLAGWAWRGASARAAAAAGAVPAGTQAQAGAGTAAAAARPVTGDEAERHATSQLLGAYVATPAGASVDELLDAAEAGAPRPDLHASLRDGQGLPVMVAAAQDLALDEIDQALRAAAETLPQPSPARAAAAEPGDELRRALALLANPLADAVAALAAWPGRFARPARAPGKPAPAAAPHRVRVLPAWPAAWTADHIELAQAWLTQQLHALGAGYVDPDAWLVQAGSAISGPELWLQADRLLATLQREGMDDVVMLLACHSDIGETTVQRLDDAGLLFGASRPKGVIPGEAAAALLLAGPRWPAATEDAPAAPHLHRAAVARRDKSADAAGRVSAELATEMLRQSLQAAVLAPEAVTGLADDADQHSTRSPELFGAMLALLPQLDATEDQRMAGHLLGRSGAAGTLLAVAMAAHRAAATGKPWAALAVGDAHWRLALVARPEAPPPAEQAAADAAAAGNKTTT